MTLPDLSAVQVAAYDAQFAAVRDRIVALVGASFGNLGSWRGDDIDGWVARILPTVLAAQRTTAQATDALLTRQAGARPSGLNLDDIVGQAVRGIDPRLVYRRAGETVWTALAQQRTLTEAVTLGRQRAEAITETDLQRVKTKAARASSKARGVTYYRRRLTGRENCALCMIASTQRYKVGDLMPIHPGCDCGVGELHADEMPPQVLDPDLLAATHDFAGLHLPGGVDYSARDYRRLIVVNDHGELGPLLGRSGHKFTGPGGMTLTGTKTSPAKAPQSNPWAHLDDEELAARMLKAAELDDEAALDEITAELDRRDQVAARKARKADTDRALRERRLQDQADKVTGLIGDGWDPYEAVEAITGRKVIDQRRAEVLADLRRNGYDARSFDQATARAFAAHTRELYRQAEDATNGYLLNRDGQARGIDPASLFTGPDVRARRYASDELRQWWDDHGRITLDDWRDQLLTGGASRKEWGGYYTR